MPEMLENSAALHARAPVVDFYGRRYSYAEALDGSRRFATGLIQRGIQPGDRIGIFLPNVPHYVAAYYGTMMAGAIAVNFSPLYSVDELIHQARDSGIRMLVTLSARVLLEPALRLLAHDCVERLVVGSLAGALPPAKAIAYRLFKARDDMPLPHDVRVLRYARLVDNDGSASLPRIDPRRDIALLQYTGGTTGRPKGAMLTHQNLTANARQVNLIDSHRGKRDVIVGVLPFFHVFANTAVLNRTIANGGQIVMLPRFDAAQTLAAVSRTRATSLPGVPTMFQALLDSPRLASTDFSSLRVCISGGAPLPLPLKARFEEATGARMVEGYGLTESSGVVSCNPYDKPGKTGTIGQPLPATRVRLLDRDDPTRAAAPGEPGELAISGPQVMRGYWNNATADAEMLRDGWLRTGDVATIDADGYLRIVDRIKDMIAVGGFKVFPSQVETVLYHHPAVREAIVIGVPDAYSGERPKAFVTLHPDCVEQCDAEEIMDWVNAHLGKHERLCAVEIRDSLPKTVVGKLSRKELVAEARAQAAREPASQDQ